MAIPKFGYLTTLILKLKVYSPCFGILGKVTALSKQERLKRAGVGSMFYRVSGFRSREPRVPGYPAG
jgi:hypothetical protein